MADDHEEGEVVAKVTIESSMDKGQLARAMTALVMAGTENPSEAFSVITMLLLNVYGQLNAEKYPFDEFLRNIREALEVGHAVEERKEGTLQ